MEAGMIAEAEARVNNLLMDFFAFSSFPHLYKAPPTP